MVSSRLALKVGISPICILARLKPAMSLTDFTPSRPKTPTSFITSSKLSSTLQFHASSLKPSTPSDSSTPFHPVLSNHAMPLPSSPYPPSQNSTQSSFSLPTTTSSLPLTTLMLWYRSLNQLRACTSARLKYPSPSNRFSSLRCLSYFATCLGAAWVSSL